MTDHTPEPWRKDGMPGGDYQLRSATGSVARVSGPGATHFVRRAIPCVNACEGMDPSALPEVVEFLRHMKDDQPGHAGEVDGTYEYWKDRARALLAKLEGGSDD